MKILVTGCAGFIGSHLCEKLLSKNNSIIGIDNFDNFYSKKIKEDNLKGFIDNPNFTFYEADIRIKNDINNIDNNIDCVIHIAAKAGVRPSIIDPQGYIDTNITGTQNILEFMKLSGIKKMVFASSSSVYGNNKETPFRENMDVSKPVSPYAFTKKACELLNYTYHHLYEIDIINLRFFTVFGPRQRPDLAINKFARLISKGEEVPMFGDGSTFRDYTYIDDTLNGIIHSINYLLNNNNVFETLNLGNNRPVKLKEMILSIAEELDKPAKIKEYPMQPGDVNKTLADTEQAERILGYKSETSFRKGIQEFIKWAKTKDFMDIN